MNPQPYNLNPTPLTLNPNSELLNPKHLTPHPDTEPLPPEHCLSVSSSLCLLSLELSDTKVYEPGTRARLGIATRSCKVVVLKLRPVVMRWTWTCKGMCASSSRGPKPWTLNIRSLRIRNLRSLIISGILSSKSQAWRIVAGNPKNQNDTKHTKKLSIF